ncbi:exported hypothetical protein [Candidatus Zixiibacteriota bacterium]|nr:exported hypothetical protein [candidate division Zixibacteria bacterium]
MRKTIFPLFLLAVLICGRMAWAGDIEKRHFSYPGDDIKTLIANFDLGAGKFIFMPKDTVGILEADVEYDSRNVEVFAEYKKRGSVGRLDVGSDLLNKMHVESEDNIWEVGLSRRYPSELTFDIGLCETDIELGGVPITYLKLDLGAADGTLKISTANPDTADDVILDAGAASFEAEKLGNLNFSRLSFDGGVGKFRLDFSGDYRVRSRARVSIGLGKALIYIPSNLPVRIEAEDNFLSTVKFRNRDRFEVEDNYFESKDFRESKIGLDLKIDVGMGSVEIIWVD